MINVRELQVALLKRGFDPGPLDGIMGPKTEAAIVEFKEANGLRARPYVGPITAGELGISIPSAKYTTEWMIEAERHLGLKEIPGKRHNKTILKWVRQLGGWFTDDETPWCGTFVAHCMRTAGHPVPKHWYRAKAWADWGQPVSAQVGAIVVFGRKGGGHVGFIVGQSATNWYVLGGNQRNEVNITPIAKSRMVNGGVGAIRWPSHAKLSLTRPPQMTGGRRTTNEA